MKKAIVIVGMALAILSNAELLAEELNKELTLNYDQRPIERYRSRELSLETFGGMTLGETTVDPKSGIRTHHDARFGAGPGVNYFFTRNIGIAAESFTENARHSLIDSADGSMVFRLPFGKSGLAAYLFGGAGHQFDPTAATSFHTGGGFEYRFSAHCGAFLEPRLIIKNGSYGFGRCGVKWIF